MMTHVAAILILLAAVPALAAPQARSPLDSIQVNGWVNSMKPERNKPLLLTVSLKNAGTDRVGPLEVQIHPFAANHDISQPLGGIHLQPHESIFRTITVVPNQSGLVVLLVGLRSGATGQLRLEKVGTVEIVDPPTYFERHRDVLTIAGPFVSALIVALIAVVVQLFLFRGGRRQKAAETVGEVVSEQARVYYATMSGAISELARSLDCVSKSTTDAERNHFARRAFFFFGIFLYKESEFTFHEGLFYLPHLWAEDVVAKLLSEVSEGIRLPLVHEAVVHKCFSDAFRIRTSYDKDDPTIRFRVRTFSDLDALLQKPPGEMTSEERDLLVAFNAALPQIVDAATIERIGAIERALRAVITYEFTELFSHWYQGENARRALPKAAPPDFEAISGDVANWDTVVRVLGKMDAAASSKTV